MSINSRRERLFAGRSQMARDSITASRELLHIAHLLEHNINEALSGFGLDMHEYIALRLISDSVHEPLRPSSLSVSLNATRTQITRLLNGLEKKGLVMRTLSEDDRRSLRLSLTDAGEQGLARMVPLVEAHYIQTWSKLSAVSLNQLAEQLTTAHWELRSRSKEKSADTHAAASIARDAAVDKP